MKEEEERKNWRPKIRGDEEQQQQQQQKKKERKKEPNQRRPVKEEEKKKRKERTQPTETVEKKEKKMVRSYDWPWQWIPSCVFNYKNAIENKVIETENS